MAAVVGEDLLLDRISDLPDSILVTILSFLPIDEAARSSILASRWRRLFPSTLFDFKAFTPHDGVINAVNSILATHPNARVRSFRTIRLNFRGEDNAYVEAWLQDLANRGIQELFLSFRRRRQRIPASLFACSSLTRLHASSCTFPDATKAAAPLARLTEIDLFDVKISKRSLNSLLSQCTALEHLKMCGVSCSSVHVRSWSLKTISSSGYFDKLFIEDAPNLERVLGNYMLRRPVHLKVAHAPTLRFLGYLGMSFHAIEIGDTVITVDGFHGQSLMPSLKTLALEVSYTTEGYSNWFMQLIMLFPCLETLYIKPGARSWVRAAALGSWDMLRSVPCIDNRLEKLVFEVYRGHESEREMAKFLHRRSRFLKTMEFHCVHDTSNEEWVRKQQELLRLDSRASSDARFLFFKGQLACNHLDYCHREWYKREYYKDLYNI